MLKHLTDKVVTALLRGDYAQAVRIHELLNATNSAALAVEVVDRLAHEAPATLQAYRSCLGLVAAGQPVEEACAAL